MRLIDADALTLVTEYDIDEGLLPHEYYEKFDVEEAPTVDAVPVIRCKDCKYWSPKEGLNPQWHLCLRMNCFRMGGDYCSRAEPISQDEGI